MSNSSRCISFSDRSVSGVVGSVLSLFVLLGSASLSRADDIDVYQPTECVATSSYRFVFLVDNSGSMGEAEFNESKATVDAAITKVLTDLTNVQVAVVQYGTAKSTLDHRYNVSIPFTSDLTAALDWDRYYGNPDNPVGYDARQDHLPASLAKMRADNVWSSGGALDITDAQNVQFVFFTDALRDEQYCCSSVYYGRTDLAGDASILDGFGEFDYLKNGDAFNGINAQFTVMYNGPINGADQAAVAAIASVGGNYEGLVESWASDPDGAAATPRRLVTGSLDASEDTSKILALLDDVFRDISMPVDYDVNRELAIDLNRAMFASDNRAFSSMFKPESFSSWHGNFKGYFIQDQGLLDVDGNAAMSGNMANARFLDTARSFWSPSADGGDPLAGGAASKLVAGSRNIFTNVASAVLTDSANILSNSNTSITNAMLGVDTDAARTAALNWIQTANLGDPLHSVPVLFRYSGREILVGMTNQGMIHGFDASAPRTFGDYSGGEELWAFMPTDLLPNLPAHSKVRSAGAHLYGLDGHITRWHKDTNNDGVINTGEQALAVFGMRRGGKNYYALDLSDPDNPRLAWKIEGGTGAFADLAQTWARPVLATVKAGGSSTQVLIFSGGYDADVLDDQNQSLASAGGAVYIVDWDGNLIWSEDSFGHSMPAEPALMDSNSDGLVDRMYLGDIDGNLWRVDFDDVQNSGSFTVNLFARLAQTGYQPFFYPPSLSLTNSGTGSKLAIAIGSGNRDMPTAEDSDNRLFVVFDDESAFGPPATSTSPINISDLYDATDGQLSSSDSTTRMQAREDLANSKGWYIRLDAGEKAMSKIVVFEGQLLATTYKALGSITDENGCTELKSEGYFYQVGLRDGTPSGTTLSGEDAQTRRTLIDAVGIPSSPVVHFSTTDGAADILVNNTVVAEVLPKIHDVLWYPIK